MRQTRMQEPPKNTNERDVRVLGWVALAFFAACGASLLAKSVIRDNFFRGEGYHPLEAQAVLCGSAAAVISAWIVIKTGVIGRCVKLIAAMILSGFQAIVVYIGCRVCWSRRRLALHVIAASIITCIAHLHYSASADHDIRNQFARSREGNIHRVIHDGINGQMLISSIDTPADFRLITIKSRADWEHDCRNWYGYHTFMQCMEDSSKVVEKLGWTADRLQRQSDEIEREFKKLNAATPVSLDQLNNLMEELQIGRKKITQVQSLESQIPDALYCGERPLETVRYTTSGRRLTVLNDQNSSQVFVQDFANNFKISAIPGRVLWRVPAPILMSLISFLTSAFCIAFLVSTPVFYVRTSPQIKSRSTPLVTA
jgi:hypothetical protein